MGAVKRILLIFSSLCRASFFLYEVPAFGSYCPGK